MLFLQINSDIPIMEQTEPTTNNDILLLLAKRLKDYRLAARMSQKELAEQSGVSQTTISHFEQGVNRNLTLNNFISLLRVLGLEQRIGDVMPELPMPPMALRKIEKLIPKRVRSGKSSVSCPLKPSDSAPLKHSTMPP